MKNYAIMKKIETEVLCMAEKEVLLEVIKIKLEPKTPSLKEIEEFFVDKEEKLKGIHITFNIKKHE